MTIPGHDEVERSEIAAAATREAAWVYGAEGLALAGNLALARQPQRSGPLQPCLERLWGVLPCGYGQ
jgi:hypothetical protein